MGGWMVGWLENEFLKKTPVRNLDLSPYLELSTLEFVKTLDNINKHKEFIYINSLKVPDMFVVIVIIKQHFG